MDNKKVKVLIGDDSTEYGIACANELVTANHTLTLIRH